MILKKPKFMISASSCSSLARLRVNLRTGVNLETQAVRLPRLQLEARHAHRAFEAEQRRGPFDVLHVERPRPDLRRLRGQRRHDRREKLIAHRDPIRAVDALLIELLRPALFDADDRVALRREPSHVRRSWPCHSRTRRGACKRSCRSRATAPSSRARGSSRRSCAAPRRRSGNRSAFPRR